jgi:esterase/lipase
MLIRHEVSDLLLRQATEQYEADYVLFHNPEESRERAHGAPILLKGTSRRMGVVLIHGFLAAPREMNELALSLHAKGYWVYCLCVRGHGTSPEDLATRSGDDWIESVDLGYAVMSAICRRVVVGGFSFGGGLALDCGSRFSRMAGVFAICPPFSLQHTSARFASTVTSWNRLMDTLHCHGAAKEYVVNIPEHPEINYARIPLAALVNMVHFMKNLETRLANVNVPTLVIQASGDPVVNAEGTALQFQHIGSEEKKYISLDFSRHGIVAGEGAEGVYSVVATFIEKL